MKVRKLVAITLITTLIASGTTMISGAEVRGAEERIVKMTQIASDSNASVPKNEIEDETTLDVADLLEATPSDATYVSNEDELKMAVEQGVNVINIDGSIELTDTLFIRRNTDIHLMGGILTCGLERPREGEDFMIMVQEGAKLTLSDIEINATGWGNENPGSNPERVYTIFSRQNSDIVILDGTKIVCDQESLAGKVKKRAFFLNGSCLMEGGTIRGFTDGGVTVSTGAKFIMNSGTITENGNFTEEENFFTAGAGIQGPGYIELNGGSVNKNEYGLWVMGNFEMNAGEVSGNIWGIYNNNAEGNEQYTPVTTINGGLISDNKIAITNLKGGTIFITNEAEIYGMFTAQYANNTVSGLALEEKERPCIIKNNESAKLYIRGGSITSQNENEIAIHNMETGKLEMTGGEITAAGTAVKNENPSVGDVKLLSGKISLTSDQGIAIDNQGYMEATGDMAIEASNKYLIAVSHEPALGGKISPSTQMAKVGDEIDITVTPNSGYRIAELTVDGVKQDVVSSHKLTVSGNHSIIAKFEKKPSSGGSSGSGGGGGSSSGSRKVSSDEEPSISETPGSWIQNETGWKFTQPDGTAYVNTWIRKNNQWYWIGADSYMVQGWTLIDGAWYYLTPISGEMKTGWLDDNGIWYYLDKDGKKVTNTTTPDGYKVDSNGAWLK